MKSSLHTHSGQFCLHAIPNTTLEQVVQEAIRKGFTTFGLSEHVPRTRTKDLYLEEQHLQVEDLEQTFAAFVKEAKRLQMAYADKIEILVGCESEYIVQADLELIHRLRSQYNLDYVVGSVHHLYEIPFDYSLEHYQALFEHHSEEQVLLDYYQAQWEMLLALKPEVVGHLDLIRIYHPDASTRMNYSPAVIQAIKRNLAEIKNYGGLVEINTSGMRKNLQDPYPQRFILQLGAQLDVSFTLSDDSHGPSHVGHCYDETLWDLLSEAGLSKLYTLTKKNGLLEKKLVLLDDLR